MDPRIAEILQQQQAQQGAGQAPQGAPQPGGAGEGANPFEDILAQFGAQQQQAPEGATQPTPEAMAAMGGGQPGGGPEVGGMGGGQQAIQKTQQIDPQTGQPIEDQTQKGTLTGTSKFLVGAIQQLQGYLQASDDRDDIATGRSVITLLTRLIDKDQQSETSKLQQA